MLLGLGKNFKKLDKKGILGNNGVCLNQFSRCTHPVLINLLCANIRASKFDGIDGR